MNTHSTTLLSLVLACTSISHLGAHFTEAQTKLHQAITNNSAEEVKQTIISSATQDKNEELTEWSFLKAILSNNTEDIKQAVQKVVAEGKNGNAPIVWAALLEKPNAAEILLDCGATIDADIVRYAISTNNAKTALTLVRGGVDIANIIDECMYLCIAKHNQIKDVDSALELMQELINHGYDVNKPWDIGIYKAFDGKAVELFLKNGAAQKQQHRRGYPIHEAIYQGAIKAVRILINAGAQIGVAAKGYMQNRALTPLMLAVKKGNLEVAKTLLDSGADINQACKVGSGSTKITPLAFAIARRNAPIVNLLLENGASSQL